VATGCRTSLAVVKRDIAATVADLSVFAATLQYVVHQALHNLQSTEQSTASYSNSVTTDCRSYTIQLGGLTGLWLVLDLAA